jgi:hypothetical protein
MQAAFPRLIGRRRSDRSKPLSRSERRLLESARTTATWMDARFSLFGFRFGLDAVVGLIPGLGDVVSAIGSVYLLWVARRLGVPRSRMARIAGLIVADLVFGLVPFVGDVADAAFKAHLRAMRIIEEHVGVAAPEPAGETARHGQRAA